MAYTAAMHQVWKDRVKAAFQQQQALQEEAARLVAIWRDEAASGTDPNFVDVDGITVAQLNAAVTQFSEFEVFMDGSAPTTQEDRRPRVSPFLI